MLVVTNGTVITGDGRTVLEQAAVVVHGEVIADVMEGPCPEGLLDYAHTVIDATGCLVFPGLINHHTHGCTVGPLWPNAAPPLTLQAALANLDRHLLWGTTTLLNLDGFASMEEVEAVRRVHPINLKTATSHTPLNVRAAQAADGRGLTEKHKTLTAERLLEEGAVCIGEIGGGHTLGGGGVDYHAIPNAVESATGIRPDPVRCRALKLAALGREVREDAYDAEKMVVALREAGLEGRLSPDEARHLVSQTVLPPFRVALEGLREAVEVARRLRVPVVLHHSLPSASEVLRLATEGGTLVVAAHCNHRTFSIDESVEWARRIKEAGGIVDIATLDAWVNRKLGTDPEAFYALLRHGVVDLVSTDYAGGFHDPIVTGLQAAVDVGAVSLPQAVALATANVAAAIPGLAPNRGRIERGRVADMVISEGNKLTGVRDVIIGGKVVVHGRRRVA